MPRMAPPPHAARISALFPRGATFNIVGPIDPADVDVRVSNNIENGTSAARGPTHTEHSYVCCRWGVARKFEIRNPKFEIRNSFRLLYALLMFLRLLLLFTIVPLIELYLLIKIGGVIGVVPTIAIVIGTGVLGAWLARWQGLAVLRRISDEMAAGRLPTDALIDGLLILVAAAVLLTPGLLTDTLGFVLLVPPSRAFVRKVVAAAIARRVPDARPDVIDAEWFREN